MEFDAMKPSVEDLQKHSLHRELPGISLYVFEEQAVHEPPSGPEYPTLHRHAVIAVDPVAAVLENAGHPVHATGPAIDLYVPVLHAEHVPPSGPE